MSKEFNLDDFKNLISLYNMKANHTLIIKKEKKYILETWSSEFNPYLRLTRLLEFNRDNLESLESASRTKLLKSMLDDAVEKEEYEEAAKIRDLILEF